MEELDRLGVVRRDDHPHPDPRRFEQLLGKAVGHPHAAVRGRIAGQRSTVQRDAVPGDALHVRHPGIVIQGRVVVLVLLDDGEDAGRRLPSRDAGRHRRTQDPAVGVIKSDLLGLDRHDRHDRLACVARRRRLGGSRGARLFRCGVGVQCRQRGDRREHRNGWRSPTAHRHGGLRSRQSIHHSIPRLKRLSALASIKCQMGSLDQKTAATIHAANFASWDIRHVAVTISHIRQPLEAEGRFAAEIGTQHGLMSEFSSGIRSIVAHKQHFREKDTTYPFAPLRGHCLVRTISDVRMLGCAIRFRERGSADVLA